MTTDADLQAEFEAMLEDDFFGEDIVYIQSGTEHEIRAFVYRNGMKQSGQRGDRAAGSAQIKYDVEIRISSQTITSVTEKADSVRLPVKIGGSATTMRVAAIIDQDLGSWHLGLNV